VGVVSKDATITYLASGIGGLAIWVGTDPEERTDFSALKVTPRAQGSVVCPRWRNKRKENASRTLSIQEPAAFVFPGPEKHDTGLGLRPALLPRGRRSAGEEASASLTRRHLSRERAKGRPTQLRTGFPALLNC